MNRLKLWVYALLVLGAAGVLVVWASRDAAARAVRELDATLGAAEAKAASTDRLMTTEAIALAERAARDPALVQALLAAEPPPTPAPRRRRALPTPPPNETARQADVERAAQGAVEAAAKGLGIALPPSFSSAASSRTALSRPAADARRREVTAWLRAAAAGEVRKGAVRLGDGIWYGAAVPAGEGGAVAVFLPLDGAWASRLSSSTGAEVSLAAGLPKPVGFGGPTAAAAAKAAMASPGMVASVGALGRVQPRPLPVDLPALPLLLASAPAARAVAVPVQGVEKAFVVLSVAAAPRLEPVVRLQWIAVAALAAALLVALVLGLFMGEGRAHVPDDLVEAAERLAARDFTARAPSLAGRLGTVAQGLNAAAEAASRASAGASAAPSPFAAEPFAAAPVPAEPSPFDRPERPTPAPEPDFAAAPAPQALFTTAKLDAAAAAPAPYAAPAPEAPAAAASLLGAAARAAPAVSAPGGDEAHWEEVFQEFLRVRTECGESAEGLTFDRFRGKLEKNKDQLVQKYGCRTVRFQVYVKEGKAALKATPVR